MKEKSRVYRGLMAMVLCLTMVLSGCSTDWISQAEQIVAALIPAAANIVTLVAVLQGRGVSAGDMSVIQNAGAQAGTDLQLIQSLIAAYQKADAAAKPGILNQIQSALGAVEGNLKGLLPALHIQDAATQAKISAVVGILLAEVQSVAAIVPVVTGQGPAASGQGSVEAKLSVKPGAPKPPLSARAFVSTYNAAMTARTGNAQLDQATAGLQIHTHGKAERTASLGLLK